MDIYYSDRMNRLNNFIDRLLVGAAFTRSISGRSTMVSNKGINYEGYICTT